MAQRYGTTKYSGGWSVQWVYTPDYFTRVKLIHNDETIIEIYNNEDMDMEHIRLAGNLTNTQVDTDKDKRYWYEDEPQCPRAAMMEFYMRVFTPERFEY